MYNHRKQTEASLRSAERRKREDEAPRLSADVPRLKTLKLEIEERMNGGSVAEPVHVRRVVVEHAPALFVITCGDPRCKDGGHDITRSVMDGLRAHQERFEGEDICIGSLGTAQCSRVLHFVCVATYS